MKTPKSPTSKTPAVPTAGIPAPPSTNTSIAAVQRTQAMTAIKETYQKNFEMMTQVTQALTTGAASVFQRQQEMLRNAMTQASATAHERIAAVASQHCPDAIDRYKKAVDASLVNVRKIAELAEQSKGDAFNLIQKRMNERLQERHQPLNVTPEPSPTRPVSTSFGGQKPNR